MDGLHLVHDVLDAQLVDHRQERVGRVDGVVLELRDGAAPRVSAILVGGEVRARRAGRWMLALRQVMRALWRVHERGVSRIPFDKVRCIGEVVQVDVDGRQLPSGHIERWLAQRIVCRLPGAMGKQQQQ